MSNASRMPPRRVDVLELSDALSSGPLLSISSILSCFLVICKGFVVVYPGGFVNCLHVKIYNSPK